MRVHLLRAAVAFALMGLMATGGRAQDPGGPDPVNPMPPVGDPGGGGEEQPPATGNRVTFDTGSPVSPVPKQLKATGSRFANTGWKCDGVTIQLLDAAGKKVDEAAGGVNTTWATTFTDLKAGDYTVRVIGDFSKDKSPPDKQTITSGKIRVQ